MISDEIHLKISTDKKRSLEIETSNIKKEPGSLFEQKREENSSLLHYDDVFENCVPVDIIGYSKLKVKEFCTIIFTQYKYANIIVA